jgi:glycosyltransferase involved in cell wall biosynthesis
VVAEKNRSEIALVVPMFNEELRINEGVFESLFNNLNNVKFIFVDDGSTDKTLMILNDLNKRFVESEIDVLANEANLGKAESIRKGFLKALQYECKYIGFTDGDFATPPEEIARLIGILNEEKPQALFGVRRKEDGNEVITNRFREFQGTIFNFLAKTLIGTNLKDPQCGTKFFLNTSALQYAISSAFMNSWLFDLEIYLRMKKRMPSLIVEEIVLNSWQHQPSSKVKILDPFRMLLTLVSLRRVYGAIK